jgi:PAS domain S-box-containing protein|tara:strand:- start:5447 stop:7747 length:2301 start_codon:yes stop_codon:yes gene_type:complete
MPSDIRTDRAAGKPLPSIGKMGFPTLMVGLFLLACLIILAASFMTVAWESNRAIERDLGRYLDKNKTIGNLILTNRKRQLEQILTSIAESPKLLTALKSGKQEAIEQSLKSALYRNNEGRLDTLILWSNLTADSYSSSTGTYDLDPLLASLADPSLLVGQPQIIGMDDGVNRPLVVLATAIHLVDASRGRLLGTLLAGLILTDNQSFIREVQTANQTNSAGLYYDKKLIAQTKGYDLPYPPSRQGVHSHRPQGATTTNDPLASSHDEELAFYYPLSLDLGADSKLTLQTSNPPGAINSLKHSVQVDFLILFSVLAPIFLLVAVLLYRFIRRSLQQVTDYAEKVVTGQDVSFIPSSIQEFNQLGKSVTELYMAWQDSEQLSQQVLNNAPSLIFIKDPDGCHLFVNKLFEEMFDKKASDIIGKTDRELFGPEMADAFQQKDKAVISMGTALKLEEIIPTKTGAKVFLTLKFPIYSKRGDLIGVCGISTDISDHKHNEIALQAAKETADLANRAKTEFLANMSHELRTPLNAIIGFSEIITAELFGKVHPRRYGDYCQEIQKSGHHLLQVINDILDVSKIEIGESELEEKVSDSASLVAAAMAMLKERAYSGEVKLSSTVPPDLPLMLVDQRRMKQILINLLSNAVKFTPARGNVKLAVRLDDAAAFHFTVTDTGIGIDQDHLEHIFEPFVQGESSYAKQFEGTGLGLTLVKKLVEQHGGDIWLTSEKGKGTVAHVVLPASRTVNRIDKQIGDQIGTRRAANQTGGYRR